MPRKSRKRKKADPFGLSRASKSSTLAFNKWRGRMSEDWFALTQRLQGHEVRKIHKGGDFVVQKRDIYGRKRGKPEIHEVKTGDSKLSPAQKRKKRRLGKRYKVDRY